MSKTYQPDAPCLHGHNSPRFVSSGQCVECNALSRRALCKKPLYNAWRNMIARCCNPRNSKYPRYGARGIKVCEAWRSYDKFIKDVGPRPDGMTLDRIDNDADYEPGNVRWASALEQSRNRQCVKKYPTVAGALTIMDAVRLTGLSERSVRYRVLELGWSMDKVLTTPRKHRH